MVEKCKGGPYGVWGICLCSVCNKRRSLEAEKVKEPDASKNLPEPDK